MTKDNNGLGDLYVMQAACGLVKIGRSADPESRRIMLVKKLRQSIYLVAVLPGRGADEEALHIKLRRHLVIGEWFYGTDKGKVAVAKTLGLLKPDWPFKWDAAASDELQRNMEVANYRKRVFGRRRRVITEISSGATNNFSNGKIWSSLDDDHIVYSSREGFLASISDRGVKWPLPDYLSDDEAARSLGPPGWSVPLSTTSPTETVVAALEALTAYQRGLSLDDDDQPEGNPRE